MALIKCPGCGKDVSKKHRLVQIVENLLIQQLNVRNVAVKIQKLFPGRVKQFLLPCGVYLQQIKL